MKSKNREILLLFIGIIAGGFLTYFFTIYGWELSFPESPQISLMFEPKQHLWVGEFSSESLTQNYTNNFDPRFNPSIESVNHYAKGIDFRVINKGRNPTGTMFIILWGQYLY
ncbi:hypothetical protein J4443_00350, partial [Candidatus Woesearchaeota archaeon]|nr:hypothetical protein [Candidatus Woesearchaeota archaeon]